MRDAVTKQRPALRHLLRVNAAGRVLLSRPLALSGGVKPGTTRIQEIPSRKQKEAMPLTRHRLPHTTANYLLLLPTAVQKLPPKLANTVASRADFCIVVVLRPMLLSSPHNFRRAPRTAVA